MRITADCTFSIIAVALLLAALCGPAAGKPLWKCGQPGQSLQETRLPEAGAAVEREMGGGEAHAYRVTLASRQFIKVVINQKGIDLAVKLSGPDGKELVEVNNNVRDSERLSAVAVLAGAYRLEVRSIDGEAKRGRYELRVEELREATARDARLVAAERVYAEAHALRRQEKAESLRKAVEKFEETLAFWRESGDRREEAETLTSIGVIHVSLGESGKALEYFNQALRLRRAAGDRRGEGQSLYGIGFVYRLLGELDKALDHQTQALPLRRAAGDREGEARTLIELGAVYGSMDDHRKALEYFQPALSLMRQLEDRRGEAQILSNIGLTYNELGERQKALEYLDQALTTQRALKDRRGEARTLVVIAGVYIRLTDFEKVLHFTSQALPVLREIGDRRTEAYTLDYAGIAQLELGEYQKALDSFNQALPLLRAAGDRHGQSLALSNMGRAYNGMGDKRKALEYYNEAASLMSRGGSLLTSQHRHGPLLYRREPKGDGVFRPGHCALARAGKSGRRGADFARHRPGRAHPRQSRCGPLSDSGGARPLRISAGGRRRPGAPVALPGIIRRGLQAPHRDIDGAS
jgi:tetratricopeptide (TPR) repeat protein